MRQFPTETLFSSDCRPCDVDMRACCHTRSKDDQVEDTLQTVGLCKALHGSSFHESSPSEWALQCCSCLWVTHAPGNYTHLHTASSHKKPADSPSWVGCSPLCDLSSMSHLKCTKTQLWGYWPQKANECSGGAVNGWQLPPESWAWRFLMWLPGPRESFLWAEEFCYLCNFPTFLQHFLYSFGEATAK